MAVPQDLLWITGGYMAVFFLCFFALNFLTRGFVGSFLRAKASRGKRVLIKIRGTTEDYYTTGAPSQTHMTFKVRGNKIQQTVPLIEGTFYRQFGIDCVDYDEGKGAFSKTDFTAVSAHDPTKTSHIIERSLMKPSLKNDVIPIITMIICIIVLLAVIVVAFKVINVEKIVLNVQGLVAPKV